MYTHAHKRARTQTHTCAYVCEKTQAKSSVWSAGCGVALQCLYRSGFISSITVSQWLYQQYRSACISRLQRLRATKSDS